MFLTKKGLVKILIVGVVYFILGSIFVALAIIDTNFGFLLKLGVYTYFLGVLFVIWGYYAEAKGKLVDLWNKSVGKELQPAKFIREYESLINSDNLVINKPNIDLLSLVSLAYYVAGDEEKTFATIDEMIATADEKNNTYANIMKISFLFSCGKHEEAEQLFCEFQGVKLNYRSTYLMDSILKDDRAMAMGDYRVAEAYNLKLLEQKFPKHSNLVKLCTHYRLGEIYECLQEDEKAVYYYKYCLANGGETVLRTQAKAKIQQLN